MINVHISTRVSKLGTAIPTINLPPIITCRKDAPCAKCAKEGGGCYAMRGHFTLPNVKNNMFENLQAYKENSKLFFEIIANVAKDYKRFRYFSSGDIVDTEFLTGMCKVARKCKDTQFLCFTKKFELVNDYVSNKHIIPKNLHIVFSTWRDFIPENPYNFPMTYVYFLKDKEANKSIPENAIPCSGSCTKCHACWELNKGQSVYFKKH